MQPHQQIFPSQGWNDNTLDNDTSLADTTSNPTTGGKGSKAKSSKKRSNANNDGEMRALFETNRESKLEDVAEDLRTNERGPNAERKRQLYAMLW